MKNLYRISILSLFLLTLLSCKDGEFDVPTFDFEDTINECNDSDSYVLSRLNSSSTEAIIVTLSSTMVANEITGDTPRETLISTSNLNYRVFDGALNPSNYFCSDIPPVSPNVLINWEAVAGANNKIFIETIELLDDTNVVTDFEHTITFENMIFDNNGETLIFENYLFGSFTTPVN